MSEVEVDNNDPQAEAATMLDKLVEAGDTEHLPDMGGPVDNQGEPKKPKKDVTAKPYKKPSVYLLFDGTEDAAYMCVRMARDKEYQSMFVCVPKLENKEDKIWSDLKPIILNENKSIKFQDLSNKSSDAEGCIMGIAETVKSSGNALIFVPWSGERIGGTSTVKRELVTRLPSKIEKIGDENKTILRLVFPNAAHGQDHFTKNRENLGLKQIFEPKEDKKSDT